MSSSISLTASARANLLSLQQTSSLLDQTQNRLSTGKKVNSASDNATAYFASQGFLNSADNFSTVKDSLGTSLQTIKAASNAIDSIIATVKQAQGLATSALQSTDTTVRAGLATQFNGLLDQINGLVTDATFNGTNLLQSTASLTVNFDAAGTTKLTVAGVSLNATGLSLTQAVSGWAGATQINASSTLLQTALTTLQTNSASFGTNSTIIQNREDYTSNLIDVLQTASDNLVLADTNEEGANLQALQARLQLGVTALGISGQETQAILKLF